MEVICVNAPYLIFQICQIILTTVNIVGFSLLYLRRKKSLFHCLACLYAFLLLDIVAEFVGFVIPVLTYYRLVDVSNNFLIMLAKEISSVCCFYFLRRSTGELTCAPVAETENRIWLLGAAFILLTKCTPASTGKAVLGCVFVIYTCEYLFTFLFALVSLRRNREQYSKRSYLLLVFLFGGSLCCYLISCMLNLRIMNGLDIYDYFAEVSWIAYSILGLIYLLWTIPRLETANQEEARFAVLKQRYSLTDREMDILRLLAQGHSNSEICSILHIAPGTAKTHIYNLYRKLEINRRSQIRDLLEETFPTAVEFKNLPF